VLHATDGLRPTTPLTERMIDHFGDTSAILTFARTASPAAMAALAAAIVDASDDPLSEALLAEGAEWIMGTIRALGWAPGERLCLLGGLGPHYAARLGAAVSAPAGTALDGALALAAEITD
jgi:glucosamine kinase